MLITRPPYSPEFRWQIVDPVGAWRFQDPPLVTRAAPCATTLTPGSCSMTARMRRVLVTDTLRIYASAKPDVLPGVESTGRAAP